MSLTKSEAAALQSVRRYVTLERAALTPPVRAQVRGYASHDREPAVRPLAPTRNGESNGWTNDVAVSLSQYTQSWILPLIDAMLAETRTVGQEMLLRMALRGEA